MNENDQPLDLEPLDPERRSPGYWHRFEHRVLTSALPALARRRRAARVTVSHVVDSWSRLLVPAAVAAAVVAAVFVGEPVEEPADQVVMGEAEVDEPFIPAVGADDLMPSFLVSDGVPDRDAVLFAIEGF